MKLLVTGGCGFIGSNFVNYMVDRYPEYEIINVDALTYAGNLENVARVEGHPGYRFIQGDIADRELIESIFQGGVDYVVNIAAESHVDRSISNPDIFIRTNIQGTQTLLDAARKYGVKKFVQVSTDEVYGTLGATGYFVEETPLAPNSPYSASKASADLLVRAYHETYGLPVNITRCSNNYGPYQFPEKLIPLMIIRSMADQALPVYGDGLNVRDWLHVMDHCRAIELVLYNGKSGEVYNIGGHNERTNLDIIYTILTSLHKPKELVQFIQDRPGHDRRYAIDASKIEKELGWKPSYTIEQGIEQTIRWYLDNEAWWKRMITGEYQQYYQQQYAARQDEAV
jgi:dTDP-glucose 4,6-dehydratase